MYQKKIIRLKRYTFHYIENQDIQGFGIKKNLKSDYLALLQGKINFLKKKLDIGMSSD